MSRKPKTKVAEMWINPSSNFKSFGHHAWDRRSTDAPNAHFLELADVALSVKKVRPSSEPALEIDPALGTAESDS
jgi:hypothetical protein